MEATRERSSLESVAIRRIQPQDNPYIERVLREGMREFQVEGPGTSAADPFLATMFEHYSAPRHAYFVAEVAGIAQGGGGIAPLLGGAPEMCELQKMFLDPALRGRGIGFEILERCFQAAKELGFTSCYLETRSNMDAARRMYLRAGFVECAEPIGATGHCGCDAWFVRDL